ncbi:729677ee-d42d-484f-aee0-fee86d017dbb [Sclerotinia trifoliorum]|uniref:729677ee-d42d-484f-aee0-fee86d017dbb n=1 Tax=Sclerotinia trifoliorum TaxID=28548 RepID=A0A8H2VR93_9HELO|nr:729677ee-d42d-484f-aee0-fee86d017dbb [Sclerotinia trifoliorum]
MTELSTALFKSVDVQARRWFLKSSDSGPRFCYSFSVLATGNGNTVGIIPFCLDGGISTLAAMIVNIGSHEARIGSATFRITLDRAEEVCSAMERLMATTNYNTAGIMMEMAAPPEFQPMLAVAPRFISQFNYTLNINPSLPTFKRPFGVSSVQKESLNDSATCPDAGTTGYGFELHTGTSNLPPTTSAFGNEHVHLWPADYHDTMLGFENKAIAAMRDGHAEEELGESRSLKQKWDTQGVLQLLYGNSCDAPAKALISNGRP